MRKREFISSAVLLYAVAMSLLLSGAFLSAQEKITVRKMGNEFVVRSEFSPTQDLVIRTWNIANEAAYLIPKNVPLKDYRKGQLIHMNSDEYPAAAFGGWGFLSGNHGSPFGRTLLIPDQRQKNLYCGKIPSLTLHTGEVVPAEGIRLDVTGKYGFLVLKLD